jgi:hypothetical protein
MKKDFLIGVAIASFCLSAFAQTESRVIGNVTIQYPANKGGTYSPQNGVSINFANGMSVNNQGSVNNVNNGIDMNASGNGIGNGAPDLSELQAQSIATAQALKASGVNTESPINLQAPPEGAADILKNGQQALQVNNEKQISQLPKQQVNTINNPQMASQIVNINTKSNNSVKSEVLTTDISAWNKTTINKFEEEGKARTEERYKEFLLKK